MSSATDRLAIRARDLTRSFGDAVALDHFSLDVWEGGVVTLLGPSGCGKSSLVKAGLLPRLSSGIRSVYVEATRDDTETRLARALRRACPWIPAQFTLAQAIAALRRGRSVYKVLIVLDQFEQWLHAHGHEWNRILSEYVGGIEN